MEPIDLDARRKHPPLEDRAEWVGALWVTVGNLEWVAQSAILRGSPGVARKALALADAIYDLADEVSNKNTWESP